MNPNITLDIMRENPEKKWNYDLICVNPGITWDIIEANPQIRWDYCQVCRNPRITFENMRNNSTKLNYIPYLLINSMKEEKRTFLERKYKEHSYREFLPELVLTVLHPKNFSKFYEWGHIDNEY